MLFAAEHLAAGGELQPLQHRHLMRELVDRRLLVAHLIEQPRGQRTQLGLVQGGQFGRLDHGHRMPDAARRANGRMLRLRAVPKCVSDDGDGCRGAQSLPRQAQYQRIELLTGECCPHFPMPTRPHETSLVEAPAGTEPVPQDALSLDVLKAHGEQRAIHRRPYKRRKPFPRRPRMRDAYVTDRHIGASW